MAGSPQGKQRARSKMIAVDMPQNGMHPLDDEQPNGGRARSYQTRSRTRKGHSSVDSVNGLDTNGSDACYDRGLDKGALHKDGSGAAAAWPHKEPLTWVDVPNMALLVLLYAMQGIPLGLTSGAMPFMLQAKLSYTQMGIFSMSSYPYSFKLLWSPIVDSVYSARFGRRKSWIVPIQLLGAALLIFSANWMQARYDDGDVLSLTVLFFVFVLLAATQDIAVDGWALMLLRPVHVEYASTCQTLGMNAGYFTSFTVFLALSNGEFSNKYIRSNSFLQGLFGFEPSKDGVVSLRGYVLFWGWVFAAITVAIALFKPEAGPGDADTDNSSSKGSKKGSNTGGKGSSSGKSGSRGEWRMEVAAAYQTLLGVAKLRPVWALSLLLVTYRLGVLPAENAAALKLLDKGVAKEALAALVLLQFPVELLSALVAGRWASTHSPYQPFMYGYMARLVFAVALTTLAAAFPSGASSFAEHGRWFSVLAFVGLGTSFTSTLMFTALGAFFNKICDPAMGGAYLTMLNTIANMGTILPKTPLFALIDFLTVPVCHDEIGAVLDEACPRKPKDMGGDNACTRAGGVCSLDVDGFYIVSYTMTVVGIFLGLLYMRLFPRLIRLPLDRWRARPPSNYNKRSSADAA